MSDDRPAMAAFDEAVIDRVAADHNQDPATLASLARRHQEGMRELPGVDDLVYEWRSQFHEDPMLHREEGVYVLAHRKHVWHEFVSDLALEDGEREALLALHAAQAAATVPGDLPEVGDRDPMVLTRP